MKPLARQPQGSTSRRMMLGADRATERLISEAQDYLESFTGVKPSISVTIAFLVKQGHKSTVAEEVY